MFLSPSQLFLNLQYVLCSWGRSFASYCFLHLWGTQCKTYQEGKAKHLSSSGKPFPRRSLVKVIQQALVGFNQADLFNSVVNGIKNNLVFILKRSRNACLPKADLWREIRESNTATVWGCLPFTPTTTDPIPVVFFQNEMLLDRNLGAYALGSKRIGISDLVRKISGCSFRFGFFVLFLPLKPEDVLFSCLGSNTCIFVWCLRMRSFSMGWVNL